MGKEKPEQANQTGLEPEQGELSGIHDYVEKFQRDREADRAAKKKETEAPREKSPEESEKKETPNEEVQTKQEESTEEPKKTEQKPQYLINEENPVIIKVDGKEIPVTDIEKLKTYAQLGYHGNLRLEDLNKREEALKEKEAVLEKSTGQLMEIQKAIDEGRLIIKTGKDSKEYPNRAKGEEESEDDSIYDDPEVQKLAKENKELKKEVSTIKELMLGTVFEKAKGDLDAQIAKAKEKYPKADDEEIWRLLAKVDEKTGKPVFAKVEDAVKHSHERIDDLINKHIAENTDLKKITPEVEEKIIMDHLAKQQELEKAPVSPPSTTSTSSEPTKSSEKKEFKSFGEAMAAASKDLSGSLRLGKKS